jgi:phosphoglucosamine mutase
MSGVGRVFVRYSGTEPVLRVLVEGPDDQLVQAVATDVVAVARAVLA